MADVGEKRGLGTVDFRERLGAPAFGLVAASIGYGGRYLAGHQLIEAAIQVIELQVRADAGHQNSGQLVRDVRPDRHDDRLSRRIGPWPQWSSRAEAVSEIVDDLHGVGAYDVRQRPGLLVRQACEVDNRRLAAIAGADASGTDQPRPVAVAIDQIKQRERNILAVLGKRLRGDGTRFLRGLCLGPPRTQVPQRNEPPFANNPLRMLDHRRKNTADGVVLGAHGAERKREVAFLWKAVALQNEKLVVRPGRFTGCDHALEHGLDDIPDFRPDFTARLSQRLRMLAPQDRGVGVVVECDELGAPVDHDGKARAEADADCRTQTLGPPIRRPDPRLRPIEGANTLAHLAAAGEELARWLVCAPWYVDQVPLPKENARSAANNSRSLREGSHYNAHRCPERQKGCASSPVGRRRSSDADQSANRCCCWSATRTSRAWM